MLKKVIDYINCNISTLKLTDKVAGLCEIIEQEKIYFPAIYENGEYRKIMDLDYTNGIIYHRVKSLYSESEDPDASVTGCDRMVERNYTMRCVAIVKKDKRQDDNYSDEVLAGVISKKILLRNEPVLRSLMRADTIETNIKSVSIQRKEIFEQEFKGLDMFIDFKYAVIAIDYDLVIGADISCFSNC